MTSPQSNFTSTGNRPPVRRPLRWVLAGLVILVVSVWVGLVAAPRLLCVGAPIQKADVIIMLGGEDGSRVPRVAALFTNGWAPHVIITGEAEMYHQELIAAGVPASVIWVDPLAHNTLENAKFSIPIMREHGCKSALIVTSWYHTRRARNCFNHVGNGLQFYLQPSYRTPEVARHWGSAVPSILKEYPKAVWYWLVYGIAPC